MILGAIVYCCFVVCSYYRILLLYPNMVEVFSVRYYVTPEQGPRITIDSIIGGQRPSINSKQVEIK